MEILQGVAGHFLTGREGGEKPVLMHSTGGKLAASIAQ
jgi:hypothetical protein